jgi:hypothetical protein
LRHFDTAITEWCKDRSCGPTPKELPTPTCQCSSASVRTVRTDFERTYPRRHTMRYTKHDPLRCACRPVRRVQEDHTSKDFASSPQSCQKSLELAKSCSFRPGERPRDNSEAGTVLKSAQTNSGWSSEL